MIGIIVEVLSVVPSILLVQFFRRIRLRQQGISPLCQTLSHLTQQRKMSISFSNNINSKKKKRLSFPWWCLFIAYGVSLLLFTLSIFFIIVRGIELGDLKTQKWLTSVLTSFFSSILIIEPLKVKLFIITLTKLYLCLFKGIIFGYFLYFSLSNNT